MLNLGTNLETALKSTATEAVWLLHLEYNEGGSSNTLYLSDRDRTVNGIDYVGLVTSWGSFNHQADLLKFSSSTGTITITLDNGKHAVLDQQFSALYQTKNFANRNWKLYLSDGDNVSTDTIGQGVVGGEINIVGDTIQLYLSDNKAKFNIEVPVSKVTTTDHPQAPEENFGRPIPMSFGDFSARTDQGTVPTVFAKHRQFVKSAFPAIITDRDDIDATPDSVGIKELRAENVFLYLNGLYATCDDSSSKVVVDTTSPLITFFSSIWFTFFPFVKNDSGSGSGIVTNAENAVDLDFDTEATLEVTLVDDFTTILSELIPRIKRLGGFKDISVHLNFDNTTSQPKDATLELITSGQTDTLAWPIGGSNLLQEVDVSNAFSTDQKSNWTFDTLGAVRELIQVKVTTGQTSSPLIVGVTYRITNYVAGDDFLNVGAPANNTNVVFTATGTTPTNYSNGSTLKAEVDVPVKEIGLEIQFAPPEQTAFKAATVIPATVWTEFKWHTLPSGRVRPLFVPHPVELTVQNINNYAPSNIQVIYFSGKGRTFGTYIDTVDGNPRATYTGVTDPGYTGNATAGDGDLNENPVYLVEQILRDEGGFDEEGIDLKTFDVSGNTTNGLIGDTFNDSVSDIKFAFSQDSFVNVFPLMQKIGSQCGTLFFISGSGKIKAKTRKQPGQYTVSDVVMSIDYNFIEGVRPTKTPMGDLSNDIVVNYNYDYGLDKTISRVDSTDNVLLKDTTSQGTTVAGIGSVLTYDFQEDLVLDETTAVQYAKAQLAWRKDRHGVLMFTSSNPLHQKLEIADVVNFVNWPADDKPFGVTLTATSIFMVSSVVKTGPDKINLTVLQVSQ